MERGKVSCNITPSDALRDFVLPIPAILGSVGLEVLVPRKGTLPLGNIARVSLNYCYCLGILHSFSQETNWQKKEPLF